MVAAPNRFLTRATVSTVLGTFRIRYLLICIWGVGLAALFMDDNQIRSLDEIFPQSRGIIGRQSGSIINTYVTNSCGAD